MDMPRTARQALGTLTATLVAATAACGSYSAYRTPALEPSHDASRSMDVMQRSIGPRAFALDPSRPVLDVVRGAWPTFMDPPWALRAAPSSSSPLIDRLGVYANGLLLGGPDVMRTIASNDVARVRRVTPSEEQKIGRAHV